MLVTSTGCAGPSLGRAIAKPCSSRKGFGSTKPHRREESSTHSCHGVETPSAPSLGSAHQDVTVWDTVHVAVPCFSCSVAHFSAGPGAAGTGAGWPGAPPGWPSLPTGPWASHLMPLCRQLAVISVEPDRWMPRGEGRSHGSELASPGIHTGSRLGLSGA